RIDQRIAVSTIGRVEGQALHAPAHAQDALAVHVPLGRALVVIAVAGRIADGGAAQAFTRVPVDAIGIGADHVDRTRGDAAAGGEVIEVSDGLLHAAPTPYADIHVGGGRQRRGIVDVREFLRIVPANAHHARGIGLHHRVRLVNRLQAENRLHGTAQGRRNADGRTVGKRAAAVLGVHAHQ